MPNKMVVVDFSKCDPSQCQNGVCLAAQACSRKLLRQEEPGDAPMSNPALCRGCGDCIRACPLKAIRMSTG